MATNGKAGGIAVQIKAPRDLERLAKAYKDAGRKDLTRQLGKQIRKDLRPAAEEAKQNALGLPAEAGNETGLRAALARSVRIQIRYSGKRVGVSVVSSTSPMPPSKRRFAKAVNKGKVRHPVFKTGTWVVQQFKGHWFDDAMKQHAPAIKAAVRRTLRQAAKDLK